MTLIFRRTNIFTVKKCYLHLQTNSMTCLAIKPGGRPIYVGAPPTTEYVSFRSKVFSKVTVFFYIAKISLEF